MIELFAQVLGQTRSIYQPWDDTYVSSLKGICIVFCPWVAYSLTRNICSTFCVSLSVMVRLDIGNMYVNIVKQSLVFDIIGITRYSSYYQSIMMYVLMCYIRSSNILCRSVFAFCSASLTVRPFNYVVKVSVISSDRRTNNDIDYILIRSRFK